MITYILIGIVFMFCIERLSYTDTFKKHIARKKININDPAIGWMERFIGILFWPICFGYFLHAFIKQYFK